MVFEFHLNLKIKRKKYTRLSGQTQYSDQTLPERRIATGLKVFAVSQTAFQLSMWHVPR